MPLMLNFSLHSTSIKLISCDKLPYRLTAKKTVVELDKKDNMDMVASSKKILINNNEMFFSQIKNNDVIVYDNNFFILINSNYGTRSFFTGLTQYNNRNSLLFRAPGRTYDYFFYGINKIISYYRDFKQVMISCNSVIYMDSASIAAMIELINLTKQLRCSIFFCSPSVKFNSYLKLANIYKLVQLIEDNKALQKNLTTMDENEKQIPFILKNQSACYVIKSNIVNYVGRETNICNIVISNPSVSRIHSAIIMIQNCIHLIDCGSTNGTFVNNKKVTPFTLQALKIDDTLLFGGSNSFNIVLNLNIV